MADAKLLAIALILAGEALAIYAEMLGAKAYAESSPFLAAFLKMLLVMTVGGGFLIAGYMLGFQAFQNIWIVTAASITSILIIEPILAYTLFQQLPTKGAMVGLALGLAGFLAALFF
ncbi:MAG: hypothetical protein HY519_03610 [Candidatus Aenigmarchaeota archaeon]|nr:hypothetical protein [Candidatus Aenigmarchaeota archaeon]